MGQSRAPGCAACQARRSLQAQENHLRHHRVCGYRRPAKRPREEFSFARAPARSGCSSARSAPLRRSRRAARRRLARCPARYRERGNRIDAHRSRAGLETHGARRERPEEKEGNAPRNRASALDALPQGARKRIPAARTRIQARRIQNAQRLHVSHPQAHALRLESERRRSSGNRTRGREASSRKAGDQSANRGGSFLRENRSRARRTPRFGSRGNDARLWPGGIRPRPAHTGQLSPARPDFIPHLRRAGSPCLDQRTRHDRPESRRRDSQRYRAGLHQGRSGELGGSAESRRLSRGARARPGTPRRQRVHRAGWRRDPIPPLELNAMVAPNTVRVLLALLLGVTAAGANLIGGSLVAHRKWSREYLKYFIALGAGFMLATALLEMIPESVRLRGDASSAYRGAADSVFVLVLAGYFLVHF